MATLILFVVYYSPIGAEFKLLIFIFRPWSAVLHTIDVEITTTLAGQVQT